MVDETWHFHGVWETRSILAHSEQAKLVTHAIAHQDALIPQVSLSQLYVCAFVRALHDLYAPTPGLKAFRRTLTHHRPHTYSNCSPSPSHLNLTTLLLTIIHPHFLPLPIPIPNQPHPSLKMWGTPKNSGSEYASLTMLGNVECTGPATTGRSDRRGSI